MRYFQQARYNLHCSDPLQDYLHAVLHPDTERKGEKELYDRSLRIEPRSLVAEMEQSAVQQGQSSNYLRRLSITLSEVTVGRLASNQKSPMVPSFGSPAHSMETKPPTRKSTNSG